jgi:hypothetical protein
MALGKTTRTPNGTSPHTQTQSTAEAFGREDISREISILRGQNTRTLKRLERLNAAFDALEVAAENQEEVSEAEPRPGLLKSVLRLLWPKERQNDWND